MPDTGRFTVRHRPINRGKSMTFDTLDAAFLTAAFLVPGFVWSSVISMLVPRRTVDAQLRIMEFLTLSSINGAIWSWALYLIFRSGLPNERPVAAALALLGIVLVSPVLLGFLTGLLQRRDFLMRFLNRFGFRPIHPVPTAWDFHFSKGNGYWVVVTLKNGSRIYGLFDQKSFAGDDSARRDLYLEAMFEPNDHGEWVPVEDSGGVWINADEIEVVEFRKLTEVTYDD